MILSEPFWREADMKTMITPLGCYYAAVLLILIPALW